LVLKHEDARPLRAHAEIRSRRL